MNGGKAQQEYLLMQTCIWSRWFQEIATQGGAWLHMSNNS